MPIGMFNRIHKYATSGETTSEGNGPGVWVCTWCHSRAQKHPVVPSGAREIELWECSVCLKMVNPVVQAAGRDFCIPCYQARAVELGRLP